MNHHNLRISVFTVDTHCFLRSAYQTYEYLVTVHFTVLKSVQMYSHFPFGNLFFAFFHQCFVPMKESSSNSLLDKQMYDVFMTLS